MTAVAKLKLTYDGYVDWLEHQPDRPRFELVDGEPVMMASERVRHVRTKLRTANALIAAIAKEKLQCEALGDGMMVKIDEYNAFEPDSLIYCSERLKGDDIVVADPVVVVEVLSPGTASVDTGKKFHGYFSLQSLRHYLIIDPLDCTIIHHHREADGTIVSTIITAGELVLDPPGLSLKVSDLFDS